MEGPLRFSTSMAESRPKADKDPAATDDDGGDGARLPGAGFYDDSEAKLANRYEDRQLAMAIEGISLERCRTVAEIEHGKKTVKKGFHNILSQQQLLDVARADNVMGPRRRSSGDTPQSSRLPSPRPRRALGTKNAHQSYSSPRQHFHPSPPSPNFSPQSQDTNRRNLDGQRRKLSLHMQEPVTRSYDGFRASRPLTSGSRQMASPHHRDSGWHMQGMESFERGAGVASKPYKQSVNSSRARTVPRVRQRGPNQYTPVQAGQNQNHSKPVQANHNQCGPVQISSTHHSVDTDDTDSDNDDVAVKQTQRPRSKSALGIDLPSSPDEGNAPDSVRDPTPTARQRSNTIHDRPHTANTASLHVRSRRELSRLTHIDAITAAEMGLRRKMWLAHQESKNHLGDAALQQKVQEFITKLDRDKKKAMQQLMLFESKDKPTEEQLVLPAV